MSERDYLKIDSPRDALAVLSLKVYKKFGISALPLIKEVCSELGQTIGAKMKKTLSDHSLGVVGQAFVDSARNRGSKVEVVEKSGEVFHLKTGKGYRCAMGLNNTDRQICEALMSMDLGIFEAATGKCLKMEILQSLAGNDSCCEIIYRLKK
jgi:hypothetical protein